MIVLSSVKGIKMIISPCPAKDYPYNADIFMYYLTFLNRLVVNEERKRIEICHYITYIYSNNDAVNSIWRKGTVTPL